MQISLDIDQDCRVFRRGWRLSACPSDPELAPGTSRGAGRSQRDKSNEAWRLDVGRGLLLWLIGIPLPIILVIWLFGGLS
jgi:hypothetical protein